MRAGIRTTSRHITSHQSQTVRGVRGIRGAPFARVGGGGALPGPYSTSYGSTVSQARVTNIRHSLEQTVRVVQRTEWRGEANN